jgi:hypothetical protein
VRSIAFFAYSLVDDECTDSALVTAVDFDPHVAHEVVVSSADF